MGNDLIFDLKANLHTHPKSKTLTDNQCHIHSEKTPIIEQTLTVI